MDKSLEVVSAEDAEKADAVVCLRKVDDPGYFSDNLIGSCNDCGSEVVFRPTAPTAPIRICVQCATERAQGGTA